MLNEIHSLNIHDSIKLDASVKLRSESVYLIIANKKKCAEILDKSDLSDDDIIDVFISLHLILEVSLNALFRQLSLRFINTMRIIKKGIDELEMIENIDNIDFITKTTLFIYNSKFNFDNKLPEAAKYHSIIGTLKKFSEMRNRLLHGHSISTIIEDGTSRDSKLKKNLTKKYLEEQIVKFKFIMEGIRFYLDCLDSSLSPEGKESYKNEFLSDDFLKNATLLKNTSF